MNILTFDTEEWFLEKKYFGDHVDKYAEFDNYLARILDLLDMKEVKGTFFCVGGMADEFPEVVKRIDGRGHEIGCHSYSHTWLNMMSRENVFEDTKRAIDSLQQCIGKKVISYRAPAFSIGESNKWIFEILADNGIERDASIYPAERDFGGFANFGQKTPCIVEYKGIRLKEFPICTTKVMGKEFAFSGGGYFRLFPLWFVKKTMAKNDYNMCYFHIDDLLPESNGVMSRADYENYFKESGTLFNRYKRYVKANLGKAGAFEKMTALISSTDFVNVETADRLIDWEIAAVVDFEDGLSLALP